MAYLGGWGTWAMGHMGNWTHGYKFLNSAWILTKNLLDIDIDVFFLITQQFFHDGFF